MLNVLNSLSVVQKFYLDFFVLFVDSLVMGEGLFWESGVVRMYVDGFKGFVGNGKEEKKYDEFFLSDEVDVSELFFLMCEYQFNVGIN